MFTQQPSRDTSLTGSRAIADQSSSASALQMQAPKEDELLQGTFVPQLQPLEEEKKMVQGKFVLQKAGKPEEEISRPAESQQYRYARQS